MAPALDQTATMYKNVLDSLEMVLPGLPTGNRALSIGGASAPEALKLAMDGRRVEIIDVSPSKCEEAKKYLADPVVKDSAPAKRMQVACLDMYTYVDTFDIVWDYHLIKKIPDEEIPKWAEKVNSLVAPAGEVVILADDYKYAKVVPALAVYGFTEYHKLEAKTVNGQPHTITVFRRHGGSADMK